MEQSIKVPDLMQLRLSNLPFSLSCRDFLVTQLLFRLYQENRKFLCKTNDNIFLSICKLKWLNGFFFKYSSIKFEQDIFFSGWSCIWMNLQRNKLADIQSCA